MLNCVNIITFSKFKTQTRRSCLPKGLASYGRLGVLSFRLHTQPVMLQKSHRDLGQVSQACRKMPVSHIVSLRPGRATQHEPKKKKEQKIAAEVVCEPESNY